MYARDWLANVASATLNLFFPPTCLGCQQPGHYICPRCAQLPAPVGDNICASCGRLHPFPIARCARCHQENDESLRWVRAATLHQGVVREALHGLKYQQQPELASSLAPYLVAAFAKTPWLQVRQQLAAVIPVPLHAERLRERGYNQAELLAKNFARHVGLPLQPSWLTRTRVTHTQVGLNAQERQENMAGAFIASPAVVGKSILLIDDVYTTGATLRACASAARQAGASIVYALALALPVHDS